MKAPLNANSGFSVFQISHSEVCFEWSHSLRNSGGLVAKHCLGKAVVVSSLRFAYFRLRLLQLRLAELDDRTQSELVPCLCQVEGKVRLIQQLLRDRQPIVGRIGIEPAGAHIARNS